MINTIDWLLGSCKEFANQQKPDKAKKVKKRKHESEEDSGYPV